MDHNYYIRSDGIFLAPFSYSNLENQRLLRNSQKDFFINNSVISCEQQRKWYESYLAKENDYMFEIIDGANNYLGLIALYNIDVNAGTAEFGRISVKDDAPRYTGTKAIEALMEFAKSELNIRKIICSVREDNKRAIFVYSKIGFNEYLLKDNIIYMECLL